MIRHGCSSGFHLPSVSYEEKKKIVDEYLKCLCDSYDLNEDETVLEALYHGLGEIEHLEFYGRYDRETRHLLEHKGPREWVIRQPREDVYRGVAL